MRRHFAFIVPFVLLTLGNTAQAAPKTPEAVTVAKTIFTKLADGNVSCAGQIDFANFKAFATDVGAIYRQMPNEKEKSSFRRAFIVSFARSFARTGAKASNLKNWRLQKSQGGSSVVATTGSTGKTLLLTVKKTGGQWKLTTLQGN